MHDHHVAHRDLAKNYIMMDGNSLYPNGFHYRDGRQTSISAKQAVQGRYHMHSAQVVYYFIYFKYSLYYEGSGPWRAWGANGQDRDAPELLMSEGQMYDPFALDIFTLGNAYKKSMLQKYGNINSLYQVVERMTPFEPADRPTISEALAIFEPMYAVRDRPAFRRRLHPHHEDSRSRYSIFGTLLLRTATWGTCLIISLVIGIIS